MNVQAAIEAPRVRAFEGTRVDAEARIGPEVLDDLRTRGHEMNVLEPWTWKVGGGHGVARDPSSGVLMGGADPRRDGHAELKMFGGGHDFAMARTLAQYPPAGRVLTQR